MATSEGQPKDVADSRDHTYGSIPAFSSEVAYAPVSANLSADTNKSSIHEKRSDCNAPDDLMPAIIAECQGECAIKAISEGFYCEDIWGEIGAFDGQSPRCRGGLSTGLVFSNGGATYGSTAKIPSLLLCRLRRPCPAP
jgi:hypothetical protein